MAIAGVAVGATKGYIYLRAEYPYVKEILLKALDDARIRHFSAKTSWVPILFIDIEIRSGAGPYVCGEETALLESIEGKRGRSEIQASVPGVQGLWGKPTVINNVETLCNIPMILCKGRRLLQSPRHSADHRNEALHPLRQHQETGRLRVPDRHHHA
jgi:NADH:ubiquinone oxidoreductase subunit F (NADH-binding)